MGGVLSRACVTSLDRLRLFWKGADFRKRSVTAMLKPYAHDFGYSLWQLVDMSWSLVANFEKMPPHVLEPLLPELARKTSGFISRIRDECAELGLEHALAKIDRALDSLRRLNSTHQVASLNSMFRELRERIQDELATRKFYYVHPRLTSYYENVDLFGPDVTRKFPSAAIDIDEAGKCLALGRHTACVFHLMRALEIGVQSLSQKLGVENVHNKPWGNLTTEMDAALKVRYPKNLTPQQKSEQAELAEILSHLNAVRIAWRNTTMHPTSVYTEDESREIFNHAKVFMRSLVNIV